MDWLNYVYALQLIADGDSNYVKSVGQFGDTLSQLLNSEEIIQIGDQISELFK